MSLTLATIVMLCAGCPASKKPSKWEAALANMAKDVVIPLEAKNQKNPLPVTNEVIQDGQRIFMISCAMCHGEDGRGQTQLGQAMYPPAMDLNSPHVQGWSDAELFWIIQNGVRLTGMPAWRTMISEADTWKLVHLIHDLPRVNAASATPAATISAPQSQAALIGYGRTLYRQEGCFMCHQFEGEGGKVGPDLTIEGTRGRSDDWLIGHFKDPQRYTPGTVMPPFKNLTDDQLRALTAFLQSQKGPKR